MKNKRIPTNIILIVFVVLLAIVPLIIKNGEEFSGADDQAQKAITEIDKNYKPWFKNVWEPPSGEVESLLFALQAAIGAGVIGYYFGRKSKKKDEDEE